MEQNGIKRRILSYSTDSSRCHNAMIDASTNTDNHTEMTLNAWTQTSSDENGLNQSCLQHTSGPIKSIIDELAQRISKLENLFHSYLLPSNVSHQTDVKPNLHNNQNNYLNGSTSTNTINGKVQYHRLEQNNFKIISEGVEVDIEPVEVEYAEDDGLILEQQDDDTNASGDSERLQICLPKENVCLKDEHDSVENQYSHANQHQFIQIRQQQQLQQHEQISQQQQQIQEIQHNVEQTQFPYQVTQHQREEKYLPNFSRPIHQANTSDQQNTSSSSIQRTSTAVYMATADNIETQMVCENPNRTLPSLTPIARSQPDRSSSTNRSKNVDIVKLLSINNRLPNAYVTLGPYNTQIPAQVYDNMDWNSTTVATRKLLTTIFERETLATHTMTGKPSPAFKGRNMPIKYQLNPNIVADIIFAVSRKCNVPEKDVKNAITTKCADENKMFKQREKKRKTLSEANKENDTASKT